MKEVYFSDYCDQKGIIPKFDENGDFRYLLTVPFENRNKGKHAIVIMKNPSNAGRQDTSGRYTSDDTVYRVLDYLYKHQNNYSQVTILNLYPHIGGETKKIKEMIKTDSGKSYIKKNDNFIKNYLNNLSETYEIIAGWGAYSDITESLYKERIKDFLKLLKEEKVYRVGSMVGKKAEYPGHGKYWYDYENLLPYPSTGIQ
ncbi:DUF1643 domain-containing protein [Peribacillus asahii]|uniref:DUF1643 domain-containing protein n=1 Tax=Peribacillus asahii TaxID=228899 RepID=UPI00207A3FF2|nr:DUF1643 domain-containing protein [Peribacillus asahii]USK62255.1 DUF1643 domain-containing protein [Peribacillus asahii]